MQNKNKIIALCWGISLFLTSFTFAAETQTDKIMPISSVNKEVPMARLWEFIKPKDSMTQEEQTAVKALFEGYKNSIQKITGGSTKINMNSDTFKNIIETNTYFYNSLKPYIDPTKLDDFNKWVSEKIAQFQQKQAMKNPNTVTNTGTLNGNFENRGGDEMTESGITMSGSEINKGPRKIGKVIKKDMKEKPSVLGKLKAQFIGLIDKIPNEKKEASFKAIIGRIDILIGKAFSDSLKHKLEELKSITQEKLDELSSDSGEDGILNQIMSDSGTTSN